MTAPGQPLLRDLIDIPTSVGDADFVVRASEGADLGRYVVTEDLRRNFEEALGAVGHAVTTGRSQAKFLHGSFGSGKSHFMAVLREILRHNPDARAVRGLGEPVAKTDGWLPGKKILTLTFHMLDAKSVEQAILEGYLTQVAALHPDAPVPAVHRSDALLSDAARLRATMGDERFFETLSGAGAGPGGGAGGLAAFRAQQAGWTAQTYAAAAAQPPGTPARDQLVSALTSTIFTNSVRSGEYLDLDTGLAVITRHARQELKYDAMVLFLDELILWLSTKIADHTFVSTEGAKLNKLVESSDSARPLPIVSFVARQRNLEEFLGPQVGGTEREALATVMRSVQGRLGEIVLADTNLPEITEKRLLKPRDEQARKVIDDAFAAVRGNREVWDTLLLGAQYGDAGIGSDAVAFRRLYPFSPALVATLVALSQALQRERTALRVMTELLVDRRDTLRVGDLIGVAELFDKLVLHGELPDRPEMRQRFRDARETYTRKLRPLLLAANGLAPDADPSGNEGYRLDDRIIRTLLLGAVVSEVPALHNLTTARLHALNFGSITSPIPGYEKQIVLDRLRRLANDAGELAMTDGPDPVISLKLSSVDYDKLLDLVPHNETASGVLQQLVREMVCAELGLGSAEGTFGELQFNREWRGRKHVVHVRFGNVRDRDTMPESALLATGDDWRLVIDYPFDPGHRRNEDFARIEQLPRGSRTVFWMPLFVTDEVMSRVAQLAKIDYLLGGGGTGDRLEALAADWSVADRRQGKIYLQQRQQQLRASLLAVLKQAYGAAKPEPADVEEDSVAVMHTLVDGLRLGDPRGGTLRAAFDNLTGDLLAWAYPGKPALPEAEKAITRGELGRVLRYAREAAADPTKGTVVEPGDRRIVARICNPLQLGELVDHRYVLAPSTCWWSTHLAQGAAALGYTEHFPVHVLRGLLDKPDARGFDRDLQNLIIAVFALEQQLAWYLNGGKVPVDSVLAVDDRLELRHPPLPDEQKWAEALRRIGGLFGWTAPAWRTPGNVAEVADRVRKESAAHAVGATKLVQSLTLHAAALGLDTTARTGRLATARRVARLLGELREERDDVVLVGLLARADVGDVDDAVAGHSFLHANDVIAALDGTNWPMIDAVRNLSATNERARTIVERLSRLAQHEQNAANLAAALAETVREATELLVRERSGDGGVVVPPVVAPPVVVPPVVDPPVVLPSPRTRSADIADATGLEKAVAEIRAEVEAGHRVRISWEVR